MSEMLPAKTPAKRRRYSPEFKAKLLKECQAPEASVASVALRYGLNTNLIHKWRRAAEASSKPSAESQFIPVPMPISSASAVAEVVFELPDAYGQIPKWRRTSEGSGRPLAHKRPATKLLPNIVPLPVTGRNSSTVLVFRTPRAAPIPTILALPCESGTIPGPILHRCQGRRWRREAIASSTSDIKHGRHSSHPLSHDLPTSAHHANALSGKSGLEV